MYEITTIALTTLFATVGPIDVAATFIALTPHGTVKGRRLIALRGVVIATIVLLVFAFVGQSVMRYMGISLAALRTAGGILLLLIGVDMAFARASGGISTTSEEATEASNKNDISVFPLATPLIAGPGAIGAIILLMAEAEGQLMMQALVIMSLLAVMILTLIALLGATYLTRVLGVTGIHVISRVFGVLLTGLAVQFIFDGIGNSGLIH